MEGTEEAVHEEGEALALPGIGFCHGRGQVSNREPAVAPRFGRGQGRGARRGKQMLLFMSISICQFNNFYILCFPSTFSHDMCDYIVFAIICVIVACECGAM